jgi:DUF4097 and DUF4098 domain-containing protein YvlB
MNGQGVFGFGSVPVISLVTLGIMSFSGCNFAMLQSKASRSSSFTVAAPIGNQCRVKAYNGSIRCVAADVSEIMVEAEITARASTQEAAEERLEQITIDVSETDGVAEIAAVIPRGSHGSVSMTLTVPYSTSMDLETSNGSIKADGLVGALKGKTSNGSVDVKDCEGSISLQTSNGKLTIDGGMLSEVDARTSNGSVRINGALAPGNHKVRTSNGSITLDTHSAPLLMTATTSNGSITANGGKVKKGETILLGLPAGVELASESDAANLTLRTSNGSVRVTHSEMPPIVVETEMPETIEAL